jgi:Zn-finger nucleic acid-binding protein
MPELEGASCACPVCSVDLQPVLLDGELVRRCPQCNGMCFERGQLESIVHIVKLFQSVRLSEDDIDSISPEERARTRCCPLDRSRMKKAEIAGLTVDLCGSCGAIWLDDGEITALKMAETHIRGNIQLYMKLGR